VPIVVVLRALYPRPNEQGREGGRTGRDVENHGAGMGTETAPAGKKLSEAAASGGRVVLLEDGHQLFGKMPQRGNLTNLEKR